MAEYFHPPKRKQASKPASKPKTAPNPKPAAKPARKKPTVRTAIKTAPAKPKKKRRSALVFLALLVLLVAAVGIFAGRMLYYSGTQRYEQTAQQFVTAMVMNDEATLSACVHPDMYGRLRPLRYGEVTNCQTEVLECEALAADALTLRIDEPITQLYRIRVAYEVQLAEQNYPCEMTVYVANIAGEAYAVKTEAINDSAIP